MMNTQRLRQGFGVFLANADLGPLGAQDEGGFLKRFGGSATDVDARDPGEFTRSQYELDRRPKLTDLTHSAHPVRDEWRS